MVGWWMGRRAGIMRTGNGVGSRRRQVLAAIPNSATRKIPGTDHNTGVKRLDALGSAPGGGDAGGGAGGAGVGGAGGGGAGGAGGGGGGGGRRPRRGAGRAAGGTGGGRARRARAPGGRRSDGGAS